LCGLKTDPAPALPPGCAGKMPESPPNRPPIEGQNICFRFLTAYRLWVGTIYFDYSQKHKFLASGTYYSVSIQVTLEDTTTQVKEQGSLLGECNGTHTPALTPFVTVDYVAFPYETYPAALMEDDPPWSFSVIEDKTKRGNNKHAYFQLATVTVTRMADGARLPVGKLYMDTKGYGVPNFLSWQVAGWEYDTPYHVTIRNVAMQTRQLRSYAYRVYIERAGVL